MSRLALALVTAAATAVSIAACTQTSATTSEPPIPTGPPAEVVLASDIVWEQLNPARGDASPQAGTLWGSRTGPGPAGFILKPIDGFRSPPHIHNIAYRGVVISGLLHNDDPGAADMWMPAGSFWTQPAGEIHITAAKGDDCLAYIEVEDGFGVLPAAEAFDDRERPVNVDVSNLVWVDPPGSEPSAGGPKVAFLWGSQTDGELSGTLLKVSSGTATRVHSNGSPLQAVVIQGVPWLAGEEEDMPTLLTPGSYFRSSGDAAHELMGDADGDTLIYLRTTGVLSITTGD